MSKKGNFNPDRGVIIMPKIIDHQQRKHAIMMAALEQFALRGYSNTKISDITELVAVSRTTLYQYFADKGEILNYAVDFILEIIGRDYENLCDNAFLTSIEKLHYLFTNIMTDVLPQRRVISVLLDLLLIERRKTFRQRLRILRRLRDVRSIIEKILEAGIRQGEIRAMDVRGMAQIIIMILLSLMSNNAVTGGVSGETAMESFSILLQGLRFQHPDYTQAYPSTTLVRSI